MICLKRLAQGAWVCGVIRLAPRVVIISAHLSKIFRGANGFIVRAPRRDGQVPPAPYGDHDLLVFRGIFTLPERYALTSFSMAFTREMPSSAHFAFSSRSVCSGSRMFNCFTVSVMVSALSSDRPGSAKGGPAYGGELMTWPRRLSRSTRATSLCQFKAILFLEKQNE